MPLPYATAGLHHGASAADLVRELQRDLRALGYLQQGIDGIFHTATDAAVRRLQFDLLHNDGHSSANDGTAAMSVSHYNQGRVTAETGVVDAGLAACIDALLADPLVPKLPSAPDAHAANRAALAAIAAASSPLAPIPFLLAIFQQESGMRHFNEPTGDDTDNFVVIGLDVDPGQPNRITSRGYGIGQFTLFHHPPRPKEMRDLIADPVGNTQHALALLRDKFEHFLTGPTAATVAADRQAEHPPATPLRLCRYQADDSRHLRDCHACAAQAAKRDLAPDTPIHAGTAQTYGQALHYPPGTYRGVPDRTGFLCDWPYAVRRYNGDGPDTYHYQARVLLHLLALGATAE